MLMLMLMQLQSWLITVWCLSGTSIHRRHLAVSSRRPPPGRLLACATSPPAIMTMIHVAVTLGQALSGCQVVRLSVCQAARLSGCVRLVCDV